MATKTETAKIITLQSEIVSRKDCFNNFGKYKYRTAEGILADIKPIANKYGFYIKLSDNLELLGNHLFIRATAELLNENCEVVLKSEAVALHAHEKKGMDLGQLSGATSSYARKYALCGLFGLDDEEQDINKNATHGHEVKAQSQNYSKINAEQLNTLREYITATNTDESRFLNAYKCDNLANFNASYFEDAITKLQSKLNQGA